MRSKRLNLCFYLCVLGIFVSFMLESPCSTIAHPLPDWAAEGNQAHARFGWSVSTAGDVNGDSYADLIVGACCYAPGEEEEGAVFVYYGQREMGN